MKAKTEISAKYFAHTAYSLIQDQVDFYIFLMENKIASRRRKEKNTANIYRFL